MPPKTLPALNSMSVKKTVKQRSNEQTVPHSATSKKNIVQPFPITTRSQRAVEAEHMSDSE